MNPTDRAIRVACQGIVLLWIVAFLGWRELAPREVRVPVSVSATIVEAPEPAPPPEEPAIEPEEPEIEEPATREEIAEQPEPAPEPEPLPEPALEPEPEPAPQIAEPLPEPPMEEIAEVAPEPPAPVEEPEPLPPAPSPSPAVAEVPEPTAIAAPALPPVPLLAVDEADVAHGGALLVGKGGFPTLESRYESFGSFRDYARAMRRLGAEFVVVDRRAIVGTIDPWTLETGSLTNPASLSPRARDYAGEPELLRASRAVRRSHGSRAEVMMLVPRRLDAGLFGGIARALAARGSEPGVYRQIRARYERGPSGGLRLRVETAVRRDGREEALPLVFDLDQLVARSRA